MASTERAAGAMDKGDLAILDLARTAFGTQLFDRLDHQKNSAHPGMIRRETAAVGIDGEVAVITQASAGDKSAAFSAFAEPEIFERRKDGIVNKS